MENPLLHEFGQIRRELHAYLCRLVVRPQVAEDLTQTAYLRCLEAQERLPDTDAGLRAWLFKVATHLAFDELRRHATWRETMLLDLRNEAEADAAVMERSIAMVGTPETQAIAREHLVACLACTLRNLPEHKAAALLLKEVHGYTVEETADLLDASAGQVKNWLQEARHHMDARYGATCALLAKTGVCHQCLELDDFFAARQGSPLNSAGTAADRAVMNTGGQVEARLRIAAELKDRPWGPWHRIVLTLGEV